MRRMPLAVISIALVVGLALASCAPGWPGAPTSTPASQEQQGGTMGQGGMMGGQGGMTGPQGTPGTPGPYQQPYPSGPGGMMGPGMMGSGMMGPGMMGGWGGYSPNAAQIAFDDAAGAVEGYLRAYYGQDLALAEVMEFAWNFYAEVEEEDTGIHAMELLIDKYTGQVYPEMGPNMMWNTKYGMMTQAGSYYGAGVPTAEMPVTPEQAKALARQFLDAYLPGLIAADADTFYGYYTLHTLKEGQVEGMLSVNGYTGTVWYHTWHGPFIGMEGFNDESEGGH